MIAPIPGTILYAPAGVIFGGFWGGVYSLIGNISGAALSFFLMRALGRASFERLIEREELEARLEVHAENPDICCSALLSTRHVHSWSRLAHEFCLASALPGK